jgi:TolA-binding protein
VLSEAARVLGSTRDFSGEVAQLNVALEHWLPATVAYRTAVLEQPWLQTAALFALQRVPAAMRDSVRHVLNAPPVVLRPRRLLSELEMAWGEPRKAWDALAPLTVDDSTIFTWREFGERAEFSDAWPVARDAWTAVMEKRGDLESTRRAALATLHAGDANGALALIARASTNAGGAAAVAKSLLPVEVAALGELGRPADAQQRIEANAQFLDNGMRSDLMKPLVDAYLRSGNLEQARAAARAGDLLDDDETAGWLALYEGDLAAARKRLVRLDARRSDQIEVLALLARTRTPSSPALGAAFLALAKHDTSNAVSRFITLADSMPEAAPAFLAMAARLEDSRNQPGADAHALTIWQRIRTDFAKSPEAPEAALAWAQALARAGDAKDAVEQLEAMLLDYSDSAMAPQARRELERLRTQVPPGGW